MIRWILLFLMVVSPLLRAAEVIQSQSRRFSIYTPRKAIVTGKVPEGSLIVEPGLLAVTAERVRQAIAMQIPALNAGGQKIHIHLMDQIGDGTVGIVSTRYNDGWNYRLAVPVVVEQARLIRALVQVLLLEYSQRTGQKPAELPAWAVEGLSQQIIHSVGPSLVVERNPVGWEASVADLAGVTRRMMRTNTPPSFHDLTTLAPPPSGAPAEGFYQSCTHLLVLSLLQAPNGKQKFAAFLQMLPLTWNWQTAFRQAYGFEKMLDVEKWWALLTVEFTSRDQRQAWSPAASLQRLNELLGTRMQWRASQNALPEDRQVDLKTVVREIDWSLQRAALTEKISQLGYTAPHLAPQIGAVALEYRKVLQRYVRERERPSKSGLRMTPEALQQKLVSDTIRRIEALDARRNAMAVPMVSSAAR